MVINKCYNIFVINNKYNDITLLLISFSEISYCITKQAIITQEKSKRILALTISVNLMYRFWINHCNNAQSSCWRVYFEIPWLRTAQKCVHAILELMAQTSIAPGCHRHCHNSYEMRLGHDLNASYRWYYANHSKHKQKQKISKYFFLLWYRVCLKRKKVC